jgi:hypothetical protein
MNPFETVGELSHELVTLFHHRDTTPCLVQRSRACVGGRTSTRKTRSGGPAFLHRHDLRSVARIYGVISRILALADRSKTPTWQAARRLAKERLAAIGRSKLPYSQGR